MSAESDWKREDGGDGERTTRKDGFQVDEGKGARGLVEDLRSDLMCAIIGRRSEGSSRMSCGPDSLRVKYKRTLKVEKKMSDMGDISLVEADEAI